MIDREKVSNGLNHCFHGQECCGDTECPYYIEHLSDSCCLEDCQENLKADVIALLKEQEAVEPIPPTDESDLWKCGNCNHQLFRCTHQRYCVMCGRAVKWE